MTEQDSQIVSIKGYAESENRFGSRFLLPFTLVVRLDLFRKGDADDRKYSLLLSLASSNDTEGVITFDFTNVRELSITDFGRQPTQITGFDIEDISARQLEEINYRI